MELNFEQVMAWLFVVGIGEEVVVEIRGGWKDEMEMIESADEKNRTKNI